MLNYPGGPAVISRKEGGWSESEKRCKDGNRGWMMQFLEGDHRPKNGSLET